MKCLTALKCFKVWAFCHFLRWLIMRCRWRCWRILAEGSKVNLRIHYTFESLQQYLPVCGLTKPRPPMYSLHGASQGGEGERMDSTYWDQVELWNMWPRWGTAHQNTTKPNVHPLTPKLFWEILFQNRVCLFTCHHISSCETIVQLSGVHRGKETGSHKKDGILLSLTSLWTSFVSRKASFVM